MEQAELELVVASHKLWLGNEPGGRRAHLSRADLSEAHLSGANLSGAHLGNVRIIGVGPAGPHRVYLTCMAIPGQPEDIRLGCERGTLASLTELAIQRYGVEHPYRSVFAFVGAWLAEPKPA